MASGILLSSSPNLLTAAGILSGLPATLGLIGLMSPTTGFQLLNFPLPADPEGKKLAQNLLLFWVSRDFFMAAVSLAAWYNDDRKMLGWIFLAGCGVTVSDAVMSRRQIGKDAWKHLIWTPLMFSLGGGLLGWFDGL